MDNLDRREWLLTNGLGSFASGTICDAHTRTYHGWLIAALEPPGQRTLLLARIDAVLEVAGQSCELGVNFWASGTVAPQGFRWLQSFQTDPIPTWTWGQSGRPSEDQAGEQIEAQTGRQSYWQLSRRLLMPYAANGLTDRLIASDQAAALPQHLLVQYQYQGSETAVLKLRPLIGDRIFHYQQRDGLQFAQQVAPSHVLLQAKRPSGFGTPWQLSWTRGEYYPDGIWYWGYRYPEETQRGLADTEDLYSPGCLVVVLAPGETVTLEARVGNKINPTAQLLTEPLTEQSFETALAVEQQRIAAIAAIAASDVAASGSDSERDPTKLANLHLRRRLLAAGDRFLAYRTSTQSPTVMAGYPWFSDWGRDTLIALPGLLLTTKRFELARQILSAFGQYCHQGLMPNAFPDPGVKPFYNAIDVALWWIETLGLYLEASQDWDFLAEQYPQVWSIYKGLMAGACYGIRVDAVDGLITWDAPQVALTWMDAVVADVPVTPRRGKPVEINALWYSALCWAKQWIEQLQTNPSALQTTALSHQVLGNQARRYATQAELVKTSLQKFWNPATGYLYDVIQPDDLPDPTIRPNAVIALSLHHCGFPTTIGQQTLSVAQAKLLTPYGLRSLDPADLRYVGQYRGGMWQRDLAYHQGTVWVWLLGCFLRSWQRFYPEQPIAFDWQPLLTHFQQQACLDSISEIFDGDPPHQPQGAVAQAWSVAEVIRCWR